MARSSPENDPLIGQQVGERFTVDQFLGQGGMATVYRAQDAASGQPVAVKLLPREVMENPDFRRRFQREVQSMAELRHPNIVSIHAAGEFQGRPWYAMDLLPYPDLEKLLEGGKVLPREDALVIAMGVASALQKVHEKGLVHRDLKPANVIVRPGPHAILMDFGLVLDSNKTQITATGAMVGTPLYMAPEMARGGQAGPYTDLYQVGLLMYEMLTGRVAQRGKDLLEVARRCLAGDFPRVDELAPDLPPSWVRLVDNLLATEVEDRYADAAEFLEDVQRLRRGQEVERIGPAPGSSPAVMDATIPPDHGGRTAPLPPGPMMGTPDPARSAAVPRTPSMMMSSGAIPQPRDALYTRVGVGVALVVAALLAAWWMTPGDVAPREVALEPGLTGFVVRWQTNDPAPTSVQVRGGQEAAWRTFFPDEDPGPSTAHELRVDGFQQGDALEVRFPLSGGEFTAARELRLPRFNVRDIEIFSIARKARLRFRTSVKAMCTLGLEQAGGRVEELPVETRDRETHEVVLPWGFTSSVVGLELVVETEAGDLVQVDLGEVLAKHADKLAFTGLSLDPVAMAEKVWVEQDDLGARLAKDRSKNPKVGLSDRLQRYLQGREDAQALRQLGRLCPWVLSSPRVSLKTRARVYGSLDRLFHIAWWAQENDAEGEYRNFPRDLGAFYEAPRTRLKGDVQQLPVITETTYFGTVSFEGKAVQAAEHEVVLDRAPDPEAVAEVSVQLLKRMKDQMALKVVVNDRVGVIFYGTRNQLKHHEELFHGLPAGYLREGRNQLRFELVNQVGNLSARQVQVGRAWLRLGS